MWEGRHVSKGVKSGGTLGRGGRADEREGMDQFCRKLDYSLIMLSINNLAS